ncbi:MAG: ribonuclease [Hungatella sp.]|nr:ribonuclease [Hungatella sp.]
MSVGEAQEDSTSPEESRSRESGAAPGDSRSPESGESQDENVSKESGEPREVDPSRESGAAQGAGLSQEEEPILEESGHYTSKEEVALYLHLYGRLPDNYLTKKEAESLGWDSKAGNLWEVAFGMSIGGSRFGNYEKALPEKKGRRYYECDIDYEGGYRGAKRIIYSDDGLIFYTEDHYKTFEQLYGQ